MLPGASRTPPPTAYTKISTCPYKMRVETFGPGGGNVEGGGKARLFSLHFFRSIKKVAHRKVVSHARSNLVILIIVD